MGTRRSRSSRAGLAGALFTPVQQRVLALVFGQPDRRFQSAELIRLARGGTGAVQRQLARLEQAGLIEATRIGNQKHYRANRDSPVFEELHRLVLKTVGLVEPLRRALTPLAPRIATAFIYGSIASGTDRGSSDIDVMIVSDRVSHAEAFEALGPAESSVGRTINPTVMKRAEWTAKRGRTGSFVTRVSEAPRLFLIGDDDDLA